MIGHLDFFSHRVTYFHTHTFRLTFIIFHSCCSDTKVLQKPSWMSSLFPVVILNGIDFFREMTWSKWLKSHLSKTKYNRNNKLLHITSDVGDCSQIFEMYYAYNTDVGDNTGHEFDNFFVHLLNDSCSLIMKVERNVYISCSWFVHLFGIVNISTKVCLQNYFASITKIILHYTHYSINLCTLYLLWILKIIVMCCSLMQTVYQNAVVTYY